MVHTILAIDDTKKILDIIKYFLENEGYEVLTSLNPRNGLEIARERKPDLILLDIMMPEMDGYTVCDELKNDERTRDIPVIMLTAKAIIMHTPKDFFYGLYGFLSKPFSKQQLLKMVASIFDVTETEEGKRDTQFIRKVDSDGEEEIKD